MAGRDSKGPSVTMTTGFPALALAMAALAARWPGALREIDQVPLVELERRERAGSETDALATATTPAGPGRSTGATSLWAQPEDPTDAERGEAHPIEDTRKGPGGSLHPAPSQRAVSAAFSGACPAGRRRRARRR